MSNSENPESPDTGKTDAELDAENFAELMHEVEKTTQASNLAAQMGIDNLKMARKHKLEHDIRTSAEDKRGAEAAAAAEAAEAAVGAAKAAVVIANTTAEAAEVAAALLSSTVKDLGDANPPAE